jgi:hypothetical protein
MPCSRVSSDDVVLGLVAADQSRYRVWGGLARSGGVWVRWYLVQRAHRGRRDSAWIVSTHPARPFSRNQAIAALTLAERLAVGYGGDDSFVLA